MILDSREIYDAMAPILKRELETTHILHCRDLESAMDIIGSETLVDMIFFDWDLAQGAGFIEAVRHGRETRHIPLVMMTHHDTHDIIAISMRHGATDYLSKPFIEKGLLSIVRRVTKNQERRRNKRLHPDSEYMLDIDLANGKRIQVRLVDFSLECFQSRGTTSLCHTIMLGDLGLAHLNIDQYSFAMDSRLIRVEEDPAEPIPTDKVLLTFRFVDKHEDRVEKLTELLDEYASRW